MSPLLGAVVNFLGVLLSLWLAVFSFHTAWNALGSGNLLGATIWAVWWAFAVYSAYMTAQYAARNWREYREGGK